VGGAVVDTAAASLIGVISHQDDPDGSPRHTTTIVRFDTGPSRALIAQAEALTKGEMPSVAVACDVR
jgi:hypothetical protein